MASKAFFNETTEQSEVKAKIVASYFEIWASVMNAVAKKYGRSSKIAYIDLFCGPGRYKNGSESTPLLILKKAINDDRLRDNLVMIFNDKDEKFAESLKKEVAAFPGKEKLKYQPEITDEPVGDDMAVQLEEIKLIPSVAFVDPWGYKGLSLRLVNAVVKDWGCECVFFFNYNRINMGINNDIVLDAMKSLFGDNDEVEVLRRHINDMSPDDRELAILDAMCQSLSQQGQTRYVLPFRFRNDKGTRTSHYIIHVSKHFLGYDIMKGIMAKASSTNDEGVASFEFCPADNRFPMLFSFRDDFAQFKNDLVTHFAGEEHEMAKVHEIFETANAPTKYIKKNYKDAILDLEKESRVLVRRKPRGHKSKVADNAIVSFPEIGAKKG